MLAPPRSLGSQDNMETLAGVLYTLNSTRLLRMDPRDLRFRRERECKLWEAMAYLSLPVIILPCNFHEIAIQLLTGQLAGASRQTSEARRVASSTGHLLRNCFYSRSIGKTASFKAQECLFHSSILSSRGYRSRHNIYLGTLSLLPQSTRE